ncbi:LuxR C-terminal-related transcriptional regulator [Streptomyces tendae]|uniref:LuxR C-terminal-related transcriptional regulator n=1 Tax=Streptomyces tendae TaxID=1932 RepID=UPI00384DDDB2
MFYSLFERSGVGMAALDSCSRIRQANDAMLALLDRSTSEVRDIEFADLVHPDSRSRLQVGFDQLRHGRTGRFTEYVKVPRPDHTAGGILTALRIRRDARTNSPLLVLLQADPPPGGARPTLLSEMEAKILERVAAGASTVQLAGQLHLSCKGIEYHISAMLRKLGVPNRPALVSRAYTIGILSSGNWPPRVQREHVKCR